MGRSNKEPSSALAAMDSIWPSVGTEVQRFLQEHFVSPSDLHLLVQSREEFVDLLRGIAPHITASERTNLGDVFVGWSGEVERSRRAKRRRILDDMVLSNDVAAQNKYAATVEAYQCLAKSNPLSLLDGLRKKGRAKDRMFDQASRAAEERRLKGEYALKLATVIREAKLPVCNLLEKAGEDAEVWSRIFGGRRGKTLRNRYKSWRPFQVWLDVTLGMKWPNSIGCLMRYAAERRDMECGKCVLDSFQASLSLLEMTGRVPEQEALCRDKTWLGYLKSLTAEINSESAETRQAPMITVATVVALEIAMFLPATSDYTQGLIWAILLMLWCSLRADDLQGVIPRTMVLNGSGFSATLGRTKTTGSDRRSKTVKIFVARSLSLTGWDWMHRGFTLWKRWETARDFLLFVPKGDYSGPTSQMLPSSRVTLMMREILRDLPVPIYKEGRWKFVQGISLYPGRLEQFYTGHSCRNFMPSVCAALRVSKPDRDYLGRWLIKGEGSAEYVRTSREVVHRLQLHVARCLITGEPFVYDEVESLDALGTFALKLGIQAFSRNTHDVVKVRNGIRCLGGPWPSLVPGEPEDLQPHECFEIAAVEPSQDKLYFVTISMQTGLRRLHLNKRCYVKAHKCQVVEYLDKVDESQFDAICRDCKAKMRLDAGVEDPESSSSEASSVSD